MEQIMKISTIIVMVGGLIAIIIPRYLPGYLVLPDPKKYDVKNTKLFRETKEKQLFILGLYLFLIGLLSFLNIKFSIVTSDFPLAVLNIILLFIIPFIFINKTEKTLKEQYTES